MVLKRLILARTDFLTVTPNNNAKNMTIIAEYNINRCPILKGQYLTYFFGSIFIDSLIWTFVHLPF